MNRQRYKLIFNRHRAMLIAVAETASSVAGQPGKNTARTGGMRASERWCFSPLSLAMVLAWSTVAHAQILVDRSAPASQQPSVITSGNGVPVINIRQANAKGLSVNRYRRFDVDGRGVILNNAGRGSQTELGGYVGGNPWLAGGGARVIVNQVHSSDASYLRGFVEVAGNKAQVIIANPSGITCAGCGFINVPRATLTTGTPIINGGDLESYRVGSGVLGVDGSGMDARSTDYTDLIARAVQVNARIWANRLKVSAGLNTVSADHAQVVAGVAPTDSAPVRAIDVAQLGGMYAGHIYLSATEHGVGVHNGGTLAATEGQLIVTAAGRLENTGTLAARIDTQINAAGAVSNTGTLGAENAVRLHAAALENRGSLSASQSLHVQIDGAVTNTGTLPESPNPSATAEDFALRVLGRNPTAEELTRGSRMNKGNCQGCWHAENVDGITVTYRPAGKASKDTLPSTATVELNGPDTINKLNLDKNGEASEIKLKFPLKR